MTAGERAARPEVPVADQAAEVLRHWHETGELRHQDGGRMSLAVYRYFVAAAGLEHQAEHNLENGRKIGSSQAAHQADFYEDDAAGRIS